MITYGGIKNNFNSNLIQSKFDNKNLDLILLKQRILAGIQYLTILPTVVNFLSSQHFELIAGHQFVLAASFSPPLFRCFYLEQRVDLNDFLSRP